MEALFRVQWSISDVALVIWAVVLELIAHVGVALLHLFKPMSYIAFIIDNQLCTFRYVNLSYISTGWGKAIFKHWLGASSYTLVTWTPFYTWTLIMSILILCLYLQCYSDNLYSDCLSRTSSNARYHVTSTLCTSTSFLTASLVSGLCQHGKFCRPWRGFLSVHSIVPYTMISGCKATR